MTIGVWVLGHQLWLEQAALASVVDQRQEVAVLMVESAQFARTRPYHQQKLVLVWSAMRHFAEELQTAGWAVSYEMADDTETALRGWIKAHGITELRLMDPVDHPFRAWFSSLNLPCEVVWLDNNHFLWSEADFNAWAAKRKGLLMESFYREGRKRFQTLMTDGEPEGGQWNFDKENRKPPKGKLQTPEPRWFEPDAITQAVIDRVQQLDTPTFGQATPFWWAVTRSQALQVLDTFITERLPTFGPYQDAMVTGKIPCGTPYCRPI